MKNVYIIGGGTAGWLTALVVNKFWENTKLTVIESSKIGILGAGEGSTPNFGQMLNLLGINQKEFYTKTGATVKTGLNFVNWTLDGRNPKHMFVINPDKTVAHPKAYHFDGKLVGQYFKEIATQRGVNIIDGEVDKIENTHEIINTIILNDNQRIENVDFVFDCSGFAKIVIDKVHNEKWISYSEYLSLNKGIAFFLPQENNYKFTDKTYTHMVSMKCGWMWQAPLQHRWGCGYVFNDKFTTIEDAKKEVENYVGKEITIQKVFNFSPGRFERTWIGNSIAIGLSYGFLEPLEATSLMTTIMQLKKLIDINFDESYSNSYNDFCASTMKQNMIFVRYHYLCERFDTPFWKTSYEMPVPDDLKSMLDEDNRLSLTSDMAIINNLKLKECNKNDIVFGLGNYRQIYNKNKKILKRKMI
jgi:tryptophan halogenase